MNKITSLFKFLESNLLLQQKIRILFGYYLFSRGTLLKILRIKLHYAPGSRNHSLLILKEIFLNQVYKFTNMTDLKLKDSQNKSVIIDVGANIGIATAYFKYHYPNSKLIAIEASPINFTYLTKNIKENKFENIQVMNCFISNNNQRIKFYHDTFKPGGSFGEGFKSKTNYSVNEFYVETKKLSDIISNLQNIVIKIDVEGAEYDILEDLASSVNISNVLEITVEVSTYNQSHFNSLNTILSTFSELGFEPRIFSDYTTKQLLNKSRQGHLQLLLIRK
jgi:FkbM family methyltransferase